MNKLCKLNLLPFTALTAGLAGWFLRALLYTTALDEKGLLSALQPVEWVLWLITLGAAAVLALRVWKLADSDHYESCFAPSAAAALGSLAMAAGILLTVKDEPSTFPGLVSKLWTITALLSVPALAAVSIYRLKGKKPFFGCHFLVCVFFLLHMVSRYQIWSSNPQLQDYFFSLAGSVLMTLFAYRQVAFEVGLGRRRLQLATGLAGVVFCLTAIHHSGTPMLYLAGAVWMLTGLSNGVPSVETEEPEAANGDS